MGLLVGLYRNGYRSNKNAFDGKSHVVVVNMEGPFEPNSDAPAAMLVKGPLGNPVIVPVVDGEPLSSVAFGGSFAATSDSRFRASVPFYGAVPVHDFDMSA